MTPVEAQLPQTITADAMEHFQTAQFKKKGTTRITTFTVPPGTPYETPEGLKAEDEETRCAWDSQGGVYPIRESVFRETYEPADG